MKKLRLALTVLIAVTAITLFTGCGDTTDTALENTKWLLESYGDSNNPQPVIEGTKVTITFNSDEDRIGGSAGCNTYFGDYNLDDGLSIGMIGNTEMYCMDPEGVMDQETEYLKILGKAEDYTIEDTALTISCGSDVLIFTPAPATE